MNRISDLTRRLWAALLALCLVLALTLPVFAEGESEIADTAEKETFHIGTVDDLLQLADSCRLDSWSKNRTVYLDADLELTGTGFAGIPSFSGVFEGQGHTISGLSLVDDGSVIGFFRYVQQGATSATSSSGAARCPPAAAPPWAALRAVTPVRLKIARLTAWYPAPARLAALPVSIRSRAASTAAR